LSGSIPLGYIFTKRNTGNNIPVLGSRNTGSTDAGRIAGKNLQ